MTSSSWTSCVSALISQIVKEQNWTQEVPGANRQGPIMRFSYQGCFSEQVCHSAATSSLSFYIVQCLLIHCKRLHCIACSSHPVLFLRSRAPGVLALHLCLANVCNRTQDPACCLSDIWQSEYHQLRHPLHIYQTADTPLLYSLTVLSLVF